MTREQPDALLTQAEKTWCPGCGNFGIMNAFRGAIRVLGERGVPREMIVMCAGIGQHAKIFDYMNLSGFYSLHGRSMATAQGIKLANPDLKVVDFVGDGDAMGEGIAHMIFAAKRNADITVVMHNNGIYALTTGQRAPTTAKGVRGPSTPRGNTEEPLNPIALMLEAGATFVARGYSGRIEQLTELMVSAIEHEGFSFLDVLQPCVTFNDTYDRYNEGTEEISGPLDFEAALALSRRADPVPLGLFYRGTRETQERAVAGERNPVRDHPTRQERLEAVIRLIGA